ncbi:M61 family metallopeptidase [Tellurirhabdus bombi]|uniref:M61 family metallopeptidase n=1 Tax=Tellurirhabdus bombi TaxID=2907205 RepID=UPI001F2A5CB4|nr:peptidase M61 [Tellurirhabdus bombi]
MKIKKTAVPFFFLYLISWTLFATDGIKQTDSYQFFIDLTNVQKDKIRVELITPEVKNNDITYNIPKIVPGTYSEDDYGRFIENLVALDRDGQSLPVVQVNVNSWKIAKANKLYKITYLVNDTFDAVDKRNKAVFEPAGVNIEQDTNFVLNNHGLMGYFPNMEKRKYEVTITHPTAFYGSTPLIDQDDSQSTDRFVTESYNHLVDSPIMYCVPDTAVVRVGNTDVLISVYSPTKKVSAHFLAQHVGPLLQAQGQYLGGNLPVNKYAFLVYLSDKPSLSGSEGALEHSYSSVYYFQEYEPEAFGAYFRDIAAHEFFHILTPLSIHSEQIHNFDFNRPQMSQHLWLYEGTTEYHAHLVQTRYDLTTPEQLLNVLSTKITSSRQQYNDRLSFTQMSANVLKKYAPQYGNVYQKGALIGLCLDIKLRQLSGGKAGLIDLVQDLSKQFGVQKPFTDDQLFDEIGKIAPTEIKAFLNEHVAGSQPLPLHEVFNLVGVKLEEEKAVNVFTMGNVLLQEIDNERLEVASTNQMNTVGQQLGYQKGDVILSINGASVTSSTYGDFRKEWMQTVKEGDELAIVVSRKNGQGVVQPVTLKTRVMPSVAKKYNQLSFIENPSPEQLATRKAWLRKS